jgi:hypothetical protein
VPREQHARGAAEGLEGARDRAAVGRAIAGKPSDRREAVCLGALGLECGAAQRLGVRAVGGVRARGRREVAARGAREDAGLGEVVGRAVESLEQQRCAGEAERVQLLGGAGPDEAEERLGARALVGLGQVEAEVAVELARVDRAAF